MSYYSNEELYDLYLEFDKYFNDILTPDFRDKWVEVVHCLLEQSTEANNRGPVYKYEELSKSFKDTVDGIEKNLSEAKEARKNE